ncbi:hypothetical protein BABINDRAFT_162805 [Babjeviella inositovora NRRL Y-12698]|uniref:IPT/TIG domain-containing protein n=1 Tax=Babjeviella inositovora NRRL Y-12698 TaxID=984486 RepID=A0A1E3QLP2_9ASCO|nr:uncharacterized protein BABINDRAFT_162805 [Babjeviella inositovora NRRL Y-12698]ODQ78605.1 hypothetical protein BABINDRAFT_162805 [Babjeviella inositovora NRRL Y-12698]
MAMAENMSHQLLETMKMEHDSLLDEFLDQRVFSEGEAGETPNDLMMADIQYTFQPRSLGEPVLSPADSSTSSNHTNIFHTPPSNGLETLPFVKPEMVETNDLFNSFITDELNMQITEEINYMGNGGTNEVMMNEPNGNVSGSASIIASPNANMSTREFQLYEVARDELSKLKFGSPQVPMNTEIELPQALKQELKAMESLAQFNNDKKLPHHMVIKGLPSCLRVETQIKLQLVFLPPPEQFLIHLSNDLISKPKLCLTNELPASVKPHLLYLDTYVLTSDNQSCEICSRCIKREQKRASRRKQSNLLAPATPAPTGGNESWDDSVSKRAVIFNCKEIISFPQPTGLDAATTSKALELSARIVCYCRHHNESKGFKILFVLRNNKDEIVSRALSDSIMIMDRKKNNAGGMGSAGSETHSTVTPHPKEAKQTVTGSPNSVDESFSSEPHTTDQASTNPNYMSFDAGTRASKRKRVEENSFGNFDPPSMLHSPLETSYMNMTLNGNSFTPPSVPHGHRPSTVSLMDISHQTDFSVNQPLLASTPPSVANNSFVVQLQHPLMASLQSYSHHQMVHMPVPPPPNFPSIQRIIPAQGPIRGGIEVTLLGCNFRPGMVVKFGANQALATHCWSDSTIVTYLPPALQPGQVLVSFENYESWNSTQAGYSSGAHQQVFTYLDDTDRQLIELALQIVGLKMNGKLEDARNIAKRIVGTDSTGGTHALGSASGNAHGASDATSASVTDEWYENAQNTANLLSQSGVSTEEILTKFLSLVDLPNCPITTPNFNLCTPEGQTMLHLATLKSFTDLVKFLIFHGCKVDCKDKQGLTPLFYAGMTGNRRLIKVLVDCKAKWDVKLSNGKMLKDYCDLNVLDMFNDLEPQELRSAPLPKSSSYDSLESMVFGFGQHILKMTEVVVDDAPSVLEAGSERKREVDEDEDGDDEYEYSSDADNEHPFGSNIPSTTERRTSVSSQEAPITLWRRVRNVFQSDHTHSHDESDSLPNYSDLFPHDPSPSQLFKVQEDKTVLITQGPSLEGSSMVLEDDRANHTSDSGDDMVMLLEKKKHLNQDKMLLFFWLPVLLLILSASVLHQFGINVIYTEKITEASSKVLRSTLGTIMLGKERVSGLFASQAVLILAAVTEFVEV